MPIDEIIGSNKNYKPLRDSIEWLIDIINIYILYFACIYNLHKNCLKLLNEIKIA